MAERNILVLRQKLPPSVISHALLFTSHTLLLLGVKLNPTFKAFISYFLLLWFWSSFCLYPVFVRWVSGPLRKLYLMVIEQKRWNMLNILNMQLARTMGKASCYFFSYTETRRIKNLSRLKDCDLFCLGMEELKGNITVVFKEKKGFCNDKRNPWCHDLCVRSKCNCIKLHKVEI